VKRYESCLVKVTGVIDEHDPHLTLTFRHPPNHQYPQFRGLGFGEEWVTRDQLRVVLQQLIAASGKPHAHEIRQSHVLMVTSDRDDLLSLKFFETGAAVRFVDLLQPEEQR
jgi:hypothetical protein